MTAVLERKPAQAMHARRRLLAEIRILRLFSAEPKLLTQAVMGRCVPMSSDAKGRVTELVERGFLLRGVEGRRATYTLTPSGEEFLNAHWELWEKHGQRYDPFL